MIDPNERQQLLDEEHLRLLRLVYIILGATYSACAAFPLIYVVFGLVITFAPAHSVQRGVDPRFLGWVLVVIGFMLTIGFAIFGGLQLYAARCLRLRRSRTLCLVAATLTCLMIPIGTALGVFTFIVLGRPTVQSMFAAGDRATGPTREASLELPRPPMQA
jgi:hypothetical protein